MSNFLESVEKSARDILRRNNDIRCNPNKTNNAKHLLSSPFVSKKLQRDRPNAAVLTKKLLPDDLKKRPTIHSLKRTSSPVRIGQDRLYRKPKDSEKCKIQELGEDGIKSSVLRKKFRCDQNLEDRNVLALDEIIGPTLHPIQRRIDEGVESIREKFKVMTNKKLGVMSNEVRERLLVELKALQEKDRENKGGVGRKDGNIPLASNLVVETKEFSLSRNIRTDEIEQETHEEIPSYSLIPGSCNVGPLGPKLISYDRSEEIECKDLTQVSLHFEKNKGDVTVITRLNLESPYVTPAFKIFDPSPLYPTEYPVEEDTNPSIPRDCVEYSEIFNHPLKSNLDDHKLCSIISVDGRGIDEEALKLDNNVGFQIDNIFFDDKGFRKLCLADEIVHNSSFPLHKFGISEESLMPNETNVTQRRMWHSADACTELLSAERGSKDFFHMVRHESSGKDGGTESIPLISIISMKAYKVKSVESIKKDKLEKIQREKQVREEQKIKDSIVQQKLDKADQILKFRLGGQDFEEEKRGPIVKNSSSKIEEVDVCDWKSLHVPVVGTNLFDLRVFKFETFSKDDNFYSGNVPRTINIVEVKSATSYKVPEEMFAITTQTQFIPDLLEDRFDKSRKIESSEMTKDLVLNGNQQVVLDHIMKVPLQENNESTNIPPDVLEHCKNNRDSVEAIADGFDENAETSTIQAARHSDFDSLEYYLDELAVDIDTADEHGNTLLIIAAQQGNKKLCKFFLRRGAYINAQNHSGNTSLHYLEKYNHSSLADYLRTKGADDTLLNESGLTCYEVRSLD